MSTKKARWMNPKSLNGLDKKDNSFPIEALGPILEGAARDIAEQVQAPVGVVAQSLLATATLACQAHADVVLDGRRYTVGNFFITVAPSGERKSEVNRIVLREIQRREDFLQKQFDEDMRLQAISRAKADLRIRNGGGKSRSGKPDRGSIPPVIVLQDVSYDGLVKSLTGGYPAPGVFSDEGATFVGGYSMAAEQIGRTAAGLCGLFEGKLVPSLRKNSNQRGHKGCRLSMHLMIQPTVAKNFFSQHFLWDQGLFTRCLILDAPGIAGSRIYRVGSVNKFPSIQTYHRQIKELMNLPLPLEEGERNVLSPKALKLTKSAKEKWGDYYNQMEKHLGENGLYRPISGVASRASEQILRLAAVLTMISNPHARKIEVDEVVNARRLVRHYLWHAKKIFSSIFVEQKVELAMDLLDWLRDQGDSRITLQRIYQFSPIRKASTARSAMMILEAHGWVLPRQLKGQEGYKINPKLFSAADLKTA